MQQYRYQRFTPVTISVPVVPLFSITLGASILMWVVAPIITFAFFFAPKTVVTPLSEEIVYAATTAEVPIETDTATVDFSKASNWLPKTQTSNSKIITPVDTYLLSIPKLNIKNALVRIGTDDLSKSLIHYGGTGIPGKEGAAVIFGHSVLPTFYDPKNYMTIFSLLPTLKEGDDIFVTFDGVDYRYQVETYRVTPPQDVSGLEQRFDTSYLTLVTCVPPGTYWKRLWVTAKLKPFGVVQS